MKRISLRLAAALLTFAVGITASAALIDNSSFDIDPPAAPPEPAHGGTHPGAGLEMVFVLDTTGSMGGLIEGAKQRIWGIVNEVMQSPSRPSVRVGLVAYRDRGDQYVTQVLPLTNDLDRVYTTLMEYRADGGGDTPEDVRRALSHGLHRAGWSQSSQNTTQIIFLVGDAPPKNYQDEPDTLRTTAEAVRRGMIVNTIQCGASPDTRQIWQQIARRGEGQFFAIAQDGGVESLSTPYDARLAELGGRLGSTYLAYGGGGGTAGRLYREAAAGTAVKTESAVSSMAPVTAQAERAVNKALNRDAYVGDLLQSIENGTVKLDDVKAADLPDNLQRLSPADRKKEVERRLAERKQIREEIVALSKQRDAHINAQRAKHSGPKTGFDAAVSAALKEQMAKKGIK